LKRGTHPAEKDGRPKDIFEMGSNYFGDKSITAGLFLDTAARHENPVLLYISVLKPAVWETDFRG
jgi:hypothetical protein